MSKNDFPEYRVWCAMKQRCFNSRNANYQNYGGRGITVCDRWKDSFEAFLADMGPRPNGVSCGRATYSLDRIDVNGNYEPSNCRWATATEQQRNRRPQAPGPETLAAVAMVAGGSLITEAASATGRSYGHIKTLCRKTGASRGRKKSDWVARGEVHHFAKLTEQQALEIKRASRDGSSRRDLARRYGVSESLVGLIARGRVWKHLRLEESA